MLKILSQNLSAANSSVLPGIKLTLDQTEQQIFSFIREAIKSIPVTPVARVAGGWIRDKLLGKPSKDIDITIEGMKGIDFANYLKKYAEGLYGPKQKVIGTIKDTEARPEQIKNLSVAFLRIFGQDVEILNLRGNEVYAEGDRNPVSVDMDATPEQDAYRRDLTINSMFYNINTNQVEDFTGTGYSDLAQMVLRTPLDPIKTFKDDPLRLLRVLRFHSRYATSKISPEVIEAMKDPEVQYMITRRMANPEDKTGIVTERTATEFKKIMIGNQPENAVKIMYETGLLQKMLNLPPSFHPLNMDQRNKHHALSVIDHTLEVIKNFNNLAKEHKIPDEDRLVGNISALWHDIGKLDPRSHKIKPDGMGYSGDPDNPKSVTHQQSSADSFLLFAKALGLTNNEKDKVHDLVLNHMNPHSHAEGGQSASDKQLRRYKAKNSSWLLQYIHAMADAMSKSKDPDAAVADPYKANLARLQDPNLYPVQLSSQDLLNGQEIMSIVGLPPMPKPGLKGYIDIVKDRIREEQYANPNFSKPEAENLVRQMVSSGAFNSYR